MLPPRLSVMLDFCAAPHSTSGAAFFISNRLFCQATVVAPFHRLASTLFCRGGAEPTSLPPSLSTRFVDPSLPPVRLSSFGGRWLLPPPRWVSTPLVDFVFRLSLLRSEVSVASATSPFRPRGAASIASPREESTTRFSRLIPLAASFYSRTAEVPRIYDRLGDLSTTSTRPSGSDHRRPHFLSRRRRSSVLSMLERASLASLECHRGDTAP